AFRNGTNMNVIESTPTSNKFSMNLEGGGTFGYNATYTQNSGVTESMLDPRLYRKVTTQQGNYWVYENVEIFPQQTGTISCKVTRKIYFDSALDAVINPPAKLMSVASMKTQGATDTTLSVIEHSGNLQNVGEIIYEGLKGAPAELGRFGSAMNAVGGVALAVNIFRGRTTKDAQTLYDALRLIENKSVSDTLAREIRDYSGLTVKHYTISNVFNGVGYVSGYAGPLGKGLSVITSLGGGWYNDSTGSELNMMWDSIMRSILAELELQDIRAAKKEKKKKITWLIDPSGYVFETIETNRISGVEASILYSDAINGDFTFWSEAEQTGQNNPQITGSDGRFAWDVPSGFWKVAFDGTGYIPSESKPMEVDPLHDKVHIGLLSLKTPVISSAALNDTGFEIEFELYMQGESIIEPVSKKTNIQLFDDNNTPIPIKDIEFVITAKNTTYKEGMTYQKDVLSTEDFVKRIRIIVDETNYPGGFKEFKEDGFTPERYYVTVLENAKSYSGVKLASYLTTDKVSVVSREKALSPSSNVPQGSYVNAQYISLTTQTEGATIYYTTDGSTPTPLSFVYNGTPVVMEKTGVLKCIASRVGMDDSDVASFQYFIGATIPTQVMHPVASTASGTYSQSLQVVLTTATEGAGIYYTLDGSEPTASKTLYTGPITISNSVTLKAIAVKTGLLNSRTVAYEYVILASSITTAEAVPTGVSLNVERTGPNVLVQTGLLSIRTGSQAMAHVPALMIQTLINHANRSDINGNLLGVLVDTPTGVTGLTTQIPTDSIRTMANRPGTGFEISSDIAGVRFDNIALQAITDQSASDTVTISVEEVPLSTLTDELKEKVSGNKVYQLTVKSGNKVISDFKGGFATVTIPYTLKEGENPHAVVVWYLNQGDMKSVRGSYVADLKAVVFTVNHFSYFMIKHDPVKFIDIPDNAWYKNAVDFIAARRITQGTGNNQYSPDAPITRGRFIVLLMNAYDITPEQYPDLLNISPFADAGNTYYTKYLAVAKGLGIVQGIGNNRFAPEQNITREEMFVMLYNVLHAIGKTPVMISTNRINDFNDINQVAPWAYDAIFVLVNAEVVNGDKGSIHPKRNTTAAETAQVLFNLLKQ
ncbi:MAG TPA: hypothetical protein DDZ89_19895, partial [Clostridiales bacterium]|nr:hypothetical protein [Clostridiales bacterium]